MTSIKQILKNGKVDSEYNVYGWINTNRNQKKLVFISLNDGSTVNNLQIVIGLSDIEQQNYKEFLMNLTKSVSLHVYGKLILSPAKGQRVEMCCKITDIKILGKVDTKTYPMSKKRHSLEFIREHPHLKVRTNIGAIVARIRNTCSFATHEFFQKKDFIYVHTPLITSNDCEGAGETFTITTTHPVNKNVILKEDLNTFKNDFFGKQAFLTVSGQLQVESYAMGLKNVYSFGPTFRAENSNTSRHLAEFWMIEPEACFITFEELMILSESYLKFCINRVLEKNCDDLNLLNKFISKGIKNSLETIVKNKFKRLSYTEAIDYLQKHYTNKVEYELPKWGDDLNSEQEKYLTSLFGPTILYNYPKEIKSFYMKINPDGKTVQAMDIIVPGIGEIIGGSMREDKYEILKDVMVTKGLLKNGHLNWYLDLRKYGSCPHGGFGLGFERLIMLVTGLKNIKDCIPFPRYPKHCIN